MRGRVISGTVAVVALLVLSGSGCARSDGSVALQVGSVEAASAALVERVLSAAETTEAVPTGRFTATTTVDGPVPFDVTIDGAFDTAADALTAEIASSVAGGTSSSVRFVDGTAYVSVPEQAAGPLDIDAGWISMDVEEYVGSGDLAGTVAPEAVLHHLKGVTGAVSTVGTEDVRGEPTTHLRLTVVPRLALDLLDPDDAEAFERYAGAALDEEIPVDVWVDDQDRARRVEVHRDVERLGAVTVVAEYFDLGVGVTVEPPPADDVVPFTEVVEDMGLGDLLPD